jgi:hypothetical protein
MMDLATAYRSTGTSLVDFTATVTSKPTYFMGTHTQCEHEEFNVSSSAGPIDVIDNVDLAPRVPLGPGDHIEVRGEMVHDPGKIPIVHWTHHDPAGRHPDGFIRFQGRDYA